MACHTFIADSATEGMRLDEAVRRQLPLLPPQSIRRAFERRDVKLDGQRTRGDCRVHAGQQIQVYVMEENAAASLQIVWEDADALIVNKPAGLSVLPDGGGISLTELCGKHVRETAPNAFAPVACHRLDIKTCGLVVFGKSERAAGILEDAFRERTMDKRYICLVKGRLKPPAATCRAYLIKDAEAARVTIVDREIRGARPIVTAYETIEAGETLSRLRVHLITGRTHQIRAHMAALGHPLLGDDVYGDRAFNRREHARRLMLCAQSLTLDTAGRLPGLDGRTFTVDCPF